MLLLLVRLRGLALSLVLLRIPSGAGLVLWLLRSLLLGLARLLLGVLGLLGLCLCLRLRLSLGLRCLLLLSLHRSYLGLLHALYLLRIHLRLIWIASLLSHLVIRRYLLLLERELLGKYCLFVSPLVGSSDDRCETTFPPSPAGGGRGKADE